LRFHKQREVYRDRVRAAFAIGVVVVVASCGSSGGVELIVAPTPEVDRVALYVGVGSELEQGIAPMGFRDPIKTTTWTRDAHNELSEVKGVDGKEVSFGLIGPADPLSIIIAIGFNADGKPIAAAVLPKDMRPLEVPSSSVSRYRLALQPIVAVDPLSKIDVRVWKPSDENAPGDKAECVLALDATTNERVAVIASGDIDCDAWPTEKADKECLPSVFMGTKHPQLDSSIECLLPISIGDTNTPASVLGGKKCVDGTGIVSGCHASNYCLPKSVLDSCTQFGGLSCAKDITAHNLVRPTYMKCHIHSDGAGNLCTDPIPGSNDPRGLINTHMCRAGTARITRPNQPWGTEVTVSQTGVNFSLTVASPTTDCNFTITPSGKVPDSTASTIEFGALLAGDLDNGRGIAIPYVFVAEPYSNGCGTPEPCTLAYSQGTFADGTLQCIDAPAL
jgi:hypothetical protein